MPGYAYLDASAITKLIVAEPERSALEAAILEKDALFSSVLAATECARVVVRLGKDPLRAGVEDVLAAFVLIQLTPALLREAGALLPRHLRSLDAIHVASALSLGASDVAFITYDHRMSEAARLHGLTVVQPGV